VYRRSIAELLGNIFNFDHEDGRCSYVPILWPNLPSCVVESDLCGCGSLWGVYGLNSLLQEPLVLS
jgi:hypothetical protein